MSVPICEKTEAGLPIGAQLVGRPGSEGLLLALARHLEEIELASAHIVKREHS
jgi:Asp-tRNA(Asn)/Glu-tRNA(Gln) amidotransferase A subunit family amidase